ncbi:MAG: tetratricopeptide repeat protein [Alistipes putredinis]|nr:MAG: tetratricopeptide repeat protein [Alistipes putredinis]
MGRSENYIAGFSLYKEGDYRNAAPYLAKVCSADDALSQNASYHLADCYLKNGRQDAGHAVVFR